jgi:molybdopterin-binding protein
MAEAARGHARNRALRIGQAAELLGVTVDTLRRWEATGRLETVRSAGGQRLIALAEVSRLLEERRREVPDRPIVAQSARNRFAGVVTRVQRDGVAAVVEVLAGPHRLVSLMTAEAVDELRLREGDEAVCVVKATNVIVEIPQRRPGEHGSILSDTDG